jgi:hypothetical protein
MPVMIRSETELEEFSMAIVKHPSGTQHHIGWLIGMAAFITVGIVAPCFASETGGLNEPPPAIPIPLDAETPLTTAAPIPVTIDLQGDSCQLYRGGEPYFIKGVGGRRHLDMAAKAGANSVRTWSTRGAGDLLDRAMDSGMTVMLGTWLSHDRADYLDPDYKSLKRYEIQQSLDNYKHHPALLVWALGNEINLKGGDTPEAWQFVNELARLIKSKDPHHPVVSVISYRASTLDKIVKYAPNLDAVGINAYAALSSVRAMVDATTYEGPYIITEWGVDGHWEADRTDWGRPIEPTSAQKVDFHLQRYKQNILANRDRCLGSYVFVWGQKQERTPTWYSMFIENLPGIDLPKASCPTVDAMHFNWSGNWPANQAPKVDGMTINGFVAAGGVRFTPGEPLVAQVAAADPENDGLRFVWELMEEPTVLGVGGSFEPRPGALGDIVDGRFPELNLMAPERAGEYRLYVYVLDENGHVGTANVPFQVDQPPAQDVATRETPASDS